MSDTRDDGGFPAHAGMDPRARTELPPLCGLPRTRGDGPASLLAVPVPCRASPHTRGWTCIRQRAGVVDGGFPAHAGMDPPLQPGRRRSQRLPRTRGDGPPRPSRLSMRHWASPHTRGWTVGETWMVNVDVGFPAHAGMDLSPANRCAVSYGLPRTRGDGPTRVLAYILFGRASPHTRGWTPESAPVSGADRGFPAHAGITQGTLEAHTTAVLLRRTAVSNWRTTTWRLSGSRYQPPITYRCGTRRRTAKAAILWGRMWGDSARLVAGSTRAARVHIVSPGLHEMDAGVEQRTIAEVSPHGRRPSMSKRSLRGLTGRLRNL